MSLQSTVSESKRTEPMQPRVNAANVSPEPQKGLFAIGKYLAECGLEPGLQELVKIRASQINGCAYCLDMHTKDARAGGETEQRIYALGAWRETPFFTQRERAALAWTEAVTLIPGGVSDELYEQTREEFSEKELVDLTWAVAAINAWNRMAISFRAVPGSYKAKTPAHAPR
jgi:AhpD family alkylhydroperoxidase